MRYRELGRTGLQVSEIGLGAEWLERHNQEEVTAVIQRCESYGINILDCWMSNPEVRTKIGNAIQGHREKWIIQGHFGSTWQEGQYVRTRDMANVQEAFQDLLARLQTDYIDLGMIHFVDSEQEFRQVMEGEFLAYVKGQKERGVIRHIGMSTHNPQVAKLAALSGEIEMLLFSVNQIVDELARDERIAQLYDLWYQDKQAARNVYDERPLHRVPLSENPDFKPIRNAVVRAAVELDVEQRQTQNQNYAPPLLPMATRLLRQVGQIFRQQFQIDPPVARLVDAKLRRKIAEKKQAHGQKLEM